MMRKRQERRQSLLSAPRRGKPVPLLKSMALAYGAVALLYLLYGVVVQGVAINADSLGELSRTVIHASLFVIPVTALGYAGTGVVGRKTHSMSRMLRWLSLFGVWLVSGAVGSMIGYELVHLAIHDDLGLSSSMAVTITLGNALIAVVVGAVFAYLETAGPQLHRQTLMLNQEKLLTAEFRAARSLQQSLLPEKDVRIYGFDISSAMIPAVEIGGDYYDYLSFADGSRGILVADAAGKGIPAALVMAKFQGMAQALSIHVATPEELFVGLNDTLRIRLDRHNFITVGMLTIDFEDRCKFYRAGHNPMFLYRAGTGEVEIVKSSGIALGLTHGAALCESLQPEEFTMNSGDIVLIYSDGLTEAENSSREQYGESSVCVSLCQAGLRGMNAASTRTALLDDLARFVGDEEPNDDVTVVVVRKV